MIIGANGKYTHRIPRLRLLAIVIHHNDLGSMPSSPIWTSYGNGTGVVGLCVHVDLVLDDLEQTSVNFAEQKVEASRDGRRIHRQTREVFGDYVGMY
jgi:hypothetical protein